VSKLRIVLITALLCLACLEGGLYYYKLKAIVAYSATTRFELLQSSAPDVFSAASDDVRQRLNGDWHNAQITVLSSERVLSRVVKALHLDTEWDLHPEKVVERLHRQIEAVLDKSTSVVSLTAWSDSPRSAASIANAIRGTYREIRLEADHERSQRLIKNTEANIESHLRTVETNKAEMESLQKKYGITATGAPSAAGTTDSPTRGQQAECAAAKQRYEASVALLRTIREYSSRQRTDSAVLPEPIKVLQEATPAP